MLDRRQVDQLREVMAEELPLLLESYLLELSRIPNQMAAALNAEDAERLRCAAHSLKGSSANFGAHGLTELLQRLEAHACAGELAHAETLLERIVEECHGVAEAVRAMLEEPR